MTSFADKPTLVGQRVLLRPLVAADADHLWHDLHDPEANRLTGTHATFTRERIDEWCATRVHQADRLDLAVVDRATGDWAGEVAINEVDADNRSCSFRIALSPSWRDKGFGTEATRLLVDHVFDTIDEPTIHRIGLEVFDFNPRARAVYERVGFRQEGVLRDALWWDGDFHDTIVMSILRTDREGGR